MSEEDSEPFSDSEGSEGEDEDAEVTHSIPAMHILQLSDQLAVYPSPCCMILYGVLWHECDHIHSSVASLRQLLAKICQVTLGVICGLMAIHYSVV